MIHALAFALASQHCASVLIKPNGSTVVINCRKVKPSPSPSPAPTMSPTPQPTATPTITPTQTPSPSPSPSQQPTIYGCAFGAPWTTDVSQAPIASNSAAMIQATLDAGATMGFSVYGPTTNETLNLADNSTPIVSVQSKVKYHAMPAQPWDPSFAIEPLSDAHALVLQTDSCQYFELYQATWANSVLSAYSGYAGPTNGWMRPSSGGCSTATCIPIGFVAIRPEELAAGQITHALGWDALAKSLGTTCVSPAAPTDCTDGYAYGGPANEAGSAMPYGSRIRLKASVSCDAMAVNAATVCRALHAYGAFAFDTSSTGNVFPGVGTLPWTSADAKSLSTITLADFDVVAP